MDGIFKKIALIFLLLAFISCKKDEKPISDHDNLVSEGKTFIKQNINMLIDSVMQFDIPSLDKKIKTEKLTIGLIDSVSYNGISNPYNFLAFKLKKSDLSLYKSPYKISLVKEKNNDTNVLFVIFSDFRIKKDDAFIVVKKVRGIGMIKNVYYFRKKSGVWVFIKKDLMNMG
jgi:hypothetical protein